MKLRPEQETIINYLGGRMGVAAVPGSGKTFTLSKLAASLVAHGGLQDDQEVLIVTLVNSAVDNFSEQINRFIKEEGLIPGMGYRVRTLHGLAHDIVRERPGLVGLPERFDILDERESTNILTSITTGWIVEHPEFQSSFTNPDYDLRRLRKEWEELGNDLANALIRQAKDLQLSPADLRIRLEAAGAHSPLLEFGCDIYARYQQLANLRAAVDFDDLMHLALKALESDPDFLERIRHRWPYILEDEAQDSSRLQESILRLLSANHNNWVRMGDSNQAIYETFTTASPEFLRSFLHERGVSAKSLSVSGRSTRSIIWLANRLADWSRSDHPVDALRSALTLPLIYPTAADDPKPNPRDNPDGIRIMTYKYLPDDEIQAVTRSVAKWLPDNPEKTVAILVPRKARGYKVVEALKLLGVPYLELLNSTVSTRQTADVLAAILRSLNEPSSGGKLADAYRRITQLDEENKDKDDIQKDVTAMLRRIRRMEDYFNPMPGHDWIQDTSGEDIRPEVQNELAAFKERMVRWQQACLLPIDQLMITIGQDLFTRPADLALVHKLALMLEQSTRNHPGMNLPEYAEQLYTIATNQRKFLGFTDEDTGFDPEKHKGKVIIATVHKAKGLEWDRVYLLSVSTYDYPSAIAGDTFIGEKWFLRGRLNLQAEALAQLNALAKGDAVGLWMEEGFATEEARLSYASERLRLLYVGITRAKEELIITWNSGQRGESNMALPLSVLFSEWEKHHAAQA
jgi:DNA helicase-2/ATP-dependent DNA helicase PcrA